jgi:hypothetical protein
MYHKNKCTAKKVSDIQNISTSKNDENNLNIQNIIDLTCIYCKKHILEKTFLTRHLKMVLKCKMLLIQFVIILWNKIILEEKLNKFKKNTNNYGHLHIFVKQ